MAHGILKLRTFSGASSYDKPEDPARTLIKVRQRIGTTESSENNQINNDFSKVQNAVTDYLDVCSGIVSEISDCFSIIFNGSEINDFQQRISELTKIANRIKSKLPTLKTNLIDFISACSEKDLKDLDNKLRSKITEYKNNYDYRWLVSFYNQSFMMKLTREDRDHEQTAKSNLNKIETEIHTIYEFYREIGKTVPEEIKGLSSVMEGQNL